jgi:hypothetical protein
MTNPSDGPAVKLPVNPLINPLTEQDRIAIEHVLARLPEIHDLLHRARECGLDVDDRFAKHEMHKVIATKLKEHFFPTQLPPADH